MVTVYTKSQCQQCEQTKEYLNRKGISFNEVNLEQNLNALNEIKAAGFRSAPVVYSGNNAWSGFRPDLLDTIGE